MLEFISQQKKQELAHKKQWPFQNMQKWVRKLKGQFVLVGGSVENKVTEMETQLGQSVS